jgi:hypothetical protein
MCRNNGAEVGDLFMSELHSARRHTPRHSWVPVRKLYINGFRRIANVVFSTVTIPAVSIPFEATASAQAGDLIQASTTMSAGAQGAVTIGYFSCFTVVAYPTL